MSAIDTVRGDKPQDYDCVCYACIKEHGYKGAFGLPYSASHFIVCKTCGNKRCPHASDHRLSCTNSNKSGQPGSVYQ